MTTEAMKPTTEQQIQLLEAEKRSLLSEDHVLWDEVNAVERELRFLRGLSGLQSDLESPVMDSHQNASDSLSDAPYAAEDAAVAMMESAARKSRND